MKWKNTNISDKPGVPLAIVSGAGLPFIGENPKNLKPCATIRKLPNKSKKSGISISICVCRFSFHSRDASRFLLAHQKAAREKYGQIFASFHGLSPVLLGISLIINSDALLWILTALSTLSLFVFLKNNERKFLILSGFFLGLSVITKYVANILFVYFFLIFFLEYIFYAHKNIAIGKYLKQALVNYVILF